MNTPIKTVLFDFDGTLVPSLELWLAAFQYALTQFEREVAEETIIRQFFFREWDIVATEFALPSGAALRGHVLDGLTQGLATAQAFPQVPALLETCRNAGLSLGLVTSAPRRQVVKALADFDLTHYFGAVVTCDDVTHFKPHPEPVEKAMAILGAAPETTLFVGDYEADVLAGHAAGTRAALYLPDAHRKFYDFERLLATKPDFIFTEHRALIPYLGLVA